MGSIEGIENLLKIVKEESQQSKTFPVLVLSAMNGVTNSLINLAEHAAEGVGFEEKLSEIEERHFSIVRALIEVKLQNPVLTQLKIYFNELSDLLQSVNTLKELSAQSKDLIVSYGERCAAFLISKVLEQSIPEARFVDARTLIKTNSNFGTAQVNYELSHLSIQDYYKANPEELWVVTGFIGSDSRGRTTTLGRGGSDYTAAILGAALNADSIEIWTDVDGMLTADPRIVKKAFSLQQLTYTEAMELSYFGAKVIYPPTMMPAFLKSIPITIRNIFNPSFPGTIIRHKNVESETPIKGISSIDSVSVLTLSGSGMIGKAGFSGRLFSLLAREDISVILITQSSSEHSITFAVDPRDTVRAKRLIEDEFELELSVKKLLPLQIEDHLSVLAIVGENMKRTPGMAGRLFNALGRNGINVRAIAQGASEYNISVIISQHDLSKGLNAIHDAFFATLKKTLHVFCLGTGNIGATLFKQIYRQHTFLQDNNDLDIRIIGISNSRKMLINPDGISLESWEESLAQQGELANLDAFISRMKFLNLPNCVFVDNTASEKPVEYYEGIFQQSISIVTCNKIANSGSYKQYKRLKTAARRASVDFFYETNVGAGLPIVRTLKELMTSGDRIIKIEAILSGTISYIFNSFKGNETFHDIVAEAQQKGFTEPDPRDDLNGRDFMRKMLILARDAGYQLEERDVLIDSILPKSCLEAKDVKQFYEELKNENDYFERIKRQAEQENKVLRYIGILEEGKVLIKLEMVKADHPFFALSGSDNIISFTTERYKERPLIVKGPGAGAEVTAAGVFAELVNVGA